MKAYDSIGDHPGDRIDWQQIKSLYGRMFPGHSADVEDEDAKKVKEQRSQELDRRDRAGDAAGNDSAMIFP